ncbi:HAD-superfamily hydrolase [Penicillium lividum]|nr:HAD-superfamily hydrolase [Penicillium lividum]
MAVSENSTRPARLKDFRALSFDCYGTLVDWENGILRAMAPLLSQLPIDHVLRNSTVEALSAFQKVKARIMKTNPTELYTNVLKQSYLEIAESFGLQADDHDKTTFAESIRNWSAFEDTLEALQRLSKHYRLVILSNVDNVSFEHTLEGPLKGVSFDAICTAEDIGSYKPDHRNFEYLFKEIQRKFAIPRHEVLHVAQSLVHDHVPAKELNIESVWISRGKEKRSGMGGDLDSLRDRVSFAWRFDTLAQLATAVEADFQA